jgi:hypothetical protein
MKSLANSNFVANGDFLVLTWAAAGFGAYLSYVGTSTITLRNYIVNNLVRRAHTGYALHDRPSVELIITKSLINFESQSPFLHRDSQGVANWKADVGAAVTSIPLDGRLTKHTG